MSVKKRFHLVLILFFLIFLAVYHPVLTQDYGVSDDFYITWVADTTFFHPLSKPAIFFDGRPLNGLWKIVTYILIDRIDEQWSVRLIALGIVVLSAAFFASLLKERFGFLALYAYGFSLIVFMLPGFSSFILWQTASVCSMGVLLGLIAGRLSLDCIDRIIVSGWTKRVFGLFALSVFIQVLAMLFYHPSAMFFGIVTLLVLLFDSNAEVNKKIIRLISHGALLGASILIFYVTVKTIAGSLPMFGDFSTPKLFHKFQLDISLIKNLTALYQLDFTGMAFWLVDGSYRINQFVHIMFVVGFALHIVLFWRGRTDQFTFLRTISYTIGYMFALICLIFVLPNLINMFAPSYNSYARHTVVFSSAYLMFLARVLYDMRDITVYNHSILVKISKNIIITFFIIIVVIVAWRVDEKVKMHTNDWDEILTDMKFLSHDVESRDLNIKISMPAFVYKRWGIGAATRDIPTHGFLMFVAAFTENGWLPENFRYTNKIDYMGLGQGTSRISFKTRFGTKIVMDFETAPYKLKSSLSYNYEFTYQNLTGVF